MKDDLMIETPPNELRRELMGISALNPYDAGDSSGRKQMYGGHLGQALVVTGATERYAQTGMEREYGKYTFSVKMPHNGRIIRVIDRYRPGYSLDSIAMNPQQVAIYERDDNKEIGYINISRYCSQHQYFGFEYKRKSALSKLRANESIGEGEVFLDSPSITDFGGYRFGVECNMVFLSVPSVSEDGVKISRQALRRFGFKTFETRVVEFGKNSFPLNMYGTKDVYKPFPEIGDIIRPDGILMALRAYDPNLAVVEQSVYDLMEVDSVFDKRTYAAGAGGRVIDIRVHHDPQNTQGTTPEGMDVQAMKYDAARREFYQDILNEYNRLKRERGAALRVTPEFSSLVVEAISVVGKNSMAPSDKINRLYRHAQLDDWRIEFVVEYDNIPANGCKVTDCHGGKGVVCKIVDESEMPIDAAGNRAELVMDGNSTVNRMNTGRLMEHYINAASRDVTKAIRAMLGINKTDREIPRKLRAIELENQPLFNKAWNYLLGYYKIVSPTNMYDWFTTGKTGSYGGTAVDHLTSIIRREIHLYMPTDNPPEYKELIAALEEHYPSTYGPVQYVGNSGKTITTLNKARIGSMYILLLEKIADDWTAVSSSKRQHFGVPAQITNSDKFANPQRLQAIRAWGEAEVRIGVSYCGSAIMAHILDCQNNPFTHKNILANILNAEQPTNIDYAVDRTIVPIGGSKPLGLINHIMQCGGLKFAYDHVV